MSNETGRSLITPYAVVRNILLLAIIGYLIAQIVGGRSSFDSLHPDWKVAELLTAFLVAVLAYQMLFSAWLLILYRNGFYRSRHTPHYARIWWLSYMYRYVPGKILLVTERARLGVRVGIPWAAGAAMPVLETLVAILAGCTVSLLAFMFFSAENHYLLFILLTIMACIVFVIPASLRWLIRRDAIARRFPELEAMSLGTGDLLLLSLPYLAHYVLLGASLFLLARGVYPLSWVDLPGICGIFALSHVVGLIVVVAPAGLGVREGALAVQLEQAMPAAIAGALAILARVWFTAIELVSFATVLLFCQQRRDNLDST
jgi:glycosyltransferase 2 family protein